VTIESGSDLLVVGGGAAGCVLAARFAAAGRTVVLVEAGPDLRGEASEPFHDGWSLPTVPDWEYHAEASDGSEGPRLRRGRLLGGTTWLTRFAVRGAVSDFEAWAARGCAGWGFDDVLPAFRRVEADLEYGNEPWHGATGPLPITRYPATDRSPIHAAAIEAIGRAGIAPIDDLNAPGAQGLSPMPMSSAGGRRVAAVDGWLDRDRQPATLRVRPDSLVDRVTIRGGRATGVRLASGETLEASEVVLSAGTYGSPPILLRSGIGPAADLRALGIPVAADLQGVGANLADHPGVDLDSGYRGGPAAGVTTHTLATFRTSGAPAGGADAMFWISDPGGPAPGFYFDPVLLRPASRGVVRIRSSDPADPPRIALPGLTDERDIERMVEAYALGLDVANDPAVRALCAEAPPRRPIDQASARQRVLDGAYSLPHVVGTCAMGPDPSAGAVVDAGAAVHGVAGLRVIDASIMPDPPSGFPYLITLMLAEYLASRLLGEH